jgi:hypothetical protein
MEGVATVASLRKEKPSSSADDITTSRHKRLVMSQARGISIGRREASLKSLWLEP